MDRLRQIEEIFQEALRRDPAERGAFVREASHGDTKLQREVLSLLANHQATSDSKPWAAAAAAKLTDNSASLEPGKCLGPYRIDSFLAAGGMGEVYRATDTRLHRQIAIKVSSARFTERFEREARVIASLNHPNICQLHDVGPNYLVMELVEGPTLADQIKQGALPLDEALAIARQIAEALEAAHEKGIVHRDLKPANVKITPQGMVKVLDFGLAKSTEESVSAAADASNSPTLTISPTRAGTILGTAAYMSPEQVRGATVDNQCDIWAFGVVLYEMLAGRRLFTGESVSDTLAAVLRADPDWSALPADAPPRVRKLLRRCLERDCKQRLQAIGEARIAIDAPEEAAVRAAARRPWAWLVSVAALAFALFAAAGWWRAAQPPQRRPVLRLSAELGPEISLAKRGFQPVMAISPDGGRLVFTARSTDGVLRLATKALDQSRSTLLAGTENAEGPFFSPTGDWIGFFADGKLKKISVRGGAPVMLCNAPGPRGASWGDDDNIIATFSLGSDLIRIPAAGGVPTSVTDAKSSKRWPQVLPGSKAVLLSAFQIGENPEDSSIEILSLKTGKRQTVQRGYFARYLHSGHLVFVRQNTLFAAPFDLNRLAVTASPQPVLDDVSGLAYSGAVNFDVSQSGTLVYLSGMAPPKQTIFWLDGGGSLQPLQVQAGQYYQPRFSPDGKRLVFTVVTGQGMDVWVQDADGGASSRKTFLPGRNWWPVWTPDGKNIIFANGPSRDMYWVRADGSGDAQRLADDSMQGIPRSFSPDKRLAFDKGNEIWTAPMEGEPEHLHLGTPTRFVDASTPVPEAEFSPDGRWMAYVSAESGISNVYVRPFPGPGGTRQISTEGGHFPIWSRSRHELFFIGLDQRIRVTSYTAGGDSFSNGIPRVLCDVRLADLGVNRSYDLAPDGKRFAVVLDAEETGQPKTITSLTVLLNFFDYVRQRLLAEGARVQ